MSNLFELHTKSHLHLLYCTHCMHVEKSMFTSSSRTKQVIKVMRSKDKAREGGKKKGSYEE